MYVNSVLHYVALNFSEITSGHVNCVSVKKFSYMVRRTQEVFAVYHLSVFDAVV